MCMWVQTCLLRVLCIKDCQHQHDILCVDAGSYVCSYIATIITSVKYKSKRMFIGDTCTLSCSLLKHKVSILAVTHQKQ